MQKAYFKGYYIKFVKDQQSIALIPGWQVDEQGNKSVFIQVITKEESFYETFPFESLRLSKKGFGMKIGDNLFMKHGAKLSINRPALTLTGSVKYGMWNPLSYHIMGPFLSVLKMQCRHDIFSMFHKINGTIHLNNERMDFQSGTGYIEGDMGRSFPKEYFWTQANDFTKCQCAIMAAVAHIPFLNVSFTGCLCAIYYHGKEYRLATYLGVKIITCSESLLILKQGKLKLRVDIMDKNLLPLLAPQNGAMKRTVYESVGCKTRYRFWIKDSLLFDLTSDQSGYEYVRSEEKKIKI